MSVERTVCPCWNDPNPPPGTVCKFCKRTVPGELAHHCHARGCTKSVRPELLMCVRHWRMVPANVQRAVWRTYRQGQCDDKRPSDAWHVAANAAVGAVATLENQPVREVEREALLAFSSLPTAAPAAADTSPASAAPRTGGMGGMR